MVQTFHTTTQTAAAKFESQLGRIYYVTPTSYLELINTFKSLLGEKRLEVKNLKDRYSNGYDCLIQTESSVNIMEKELVDLQPILVQKGKETEEKLVIVTKETEAADKIK
jgi:dynein heavy chain